MPVNPHAWLWKCLDFDNGLESGRSAFTLTPYGCILVSLFKVSLFSIDSSKPQTCNDKGKEVIIRTVTNAVNAYPDEKSIIVDAILSSGRDEDDSIIFETRWTDDNISWEPCSSFVGGDGTWCPYTHSFTS